MTELWDLNKPIITAINGFAIGGGFEIALACDLLVVVEAAEFALPEMQRDAGAIQRLPRRIPYNVAIELMLTGRRMSARKAAQWGLANAVVEPTELLWPRPERRAGVLTFAKRRSSGSSPASTRCPRNP
jgi:crotonobetainyl-CoA hydratase